MELRFRALMVNILLPAFHRKEWCQSGQGGLIDRAHDAAAHALVPCGKGHVCQRNAGVGGSCREMLG